MPPKPGKARPGLVVKLGGSLFGSPHLASWLAAVADLEGRAVLVAGGGPFADAVRQAQVRRPFGDAAAHRMAILAMEQFAWMLADLEPRLQPADEPSSIAEARGSGRTPVWLPSRMTFGAPDLPESWDLTSDSLALWLARRLGIQRVLLVKSAALPPGFASARALATAGVVDPLLPSFLAHPEMECRCIESARASAFAEAEQSGHSIGTLLALDP